MSCRCPRSAEPKAWSVTARSSAAGSSGKRDNPETVVSLAEDRANTNQEHKLIELYRDALRTFQISLDYWKIDQNEQWYEPQDLWPLASIRLQKAQGLYFGNLQQIRKTEAMEKAVAAKILNKLFEDMIVAVARADPDHYHCRMSCSICLSSDRKMISLAKAVTTLKQCPLCCEGFAAWFSVLASPAKVR